MAASTEGLGPRCCARKHTANVLLGLRTCLPHGLIAYYEAHPPKGEIVLLIGPPPELIASEADADALLAEALTTLKPSQAAAQVAKVTGVDRKTLYARAMELRAG